MQHVILVEFTVDPEKVAEFEGLMIENATRSVTDEPGCLRFDVLRRLDNPNIIELYEIYTDAEAFEAHRRSPHFQSFDRASAPLVTAKRVIAANFVAGSPPPK